MDGVRVFGPTGRDQTYTPQGEPTFRKGAKGGGKGVGALGAGVGRVRFEEVAGAGDGLDAAGRGNALKMSAEVLGPVGAQVVGVVEGLLLQKPASPVPAIHTRK